MKTNRVLQTDVNKELHYFSETNRHTYNTGIFFSLILRVAVEVTNKALEPHDVTHGMSNLMSYSSSIHDGFL